MSHTTLSEQDCFFSASAQANKIWSGVYRNHLTVHEFVLLKFFGVRPLSQLLLCVTWISRLRYRRHISIIGLFTCLSLHLYVCLSLALASEHSPIGWLQWNFLYMRIIKYRSSWHVPRGLVYNLLKLFLSQWIYVFVAKVFNIVQILL